MLETIFDNFHYWIGDNPLDYVINEQGEFCLDGLKIDHYSIPGFSENFVKIVDQDFILEGPYLIPLKFLEGREVLEAIIDNFPSLNPQEVRSDFNIKIPKPEIKEIKGTPYLLVTHPSWVDNNQIFGLGVSVNGKVVLNDDGFLWGGESILHAFVCDSEGYKIKELGHNCRGMIYEISNGNDIINIMEVHDVNMGINAISNFQLQCAGGGLFNINQYFINALRALGVNNDLVIDDLVSGIKEFNYSYNINNEMPLESIIMKINELEIIKPQLIKGLLNESLIQDMYASLFNKGDIYSARELSKWSGVNPNWGLFDVQSVYASLFNKGDIFIARELSEWSGVNPDWELFDVQSLYASLFSECYLLSARSLSEWSGIMPSNEVIQSLYASLLNRNFISDALGLSE